MFRVDHFHHYPDISEVVIRLKRLEGLITRNQERLMATIAELTAAVTRNTDVDESVLAMVTGIVQQLKDAQAQNDPAAIAALITQLDANTAKMSEAVTANTPSA